MLGVNTLIDSHYYGKFTVTWFNFFMYNVYHNIGDHYGTHPWHWYLSQGLPTLLFSLTIPFVFGLLFKLKSDWSHMGFPFAAICFNIFIYRLV